MTSCVSKGEGLSFNLHMEGGEFQRAEGSAPKFSILLELSALDDVTGFKNAIEQGGHDVNESGFWYSRRIGSPKMALEERKPLMIAALYGSKRVLRYILEKGVVDVNEACGSDRVTPLHCAVSGGSNSSFEVVKLLLDACADVDLMDADGNRPADLISRHHICSKSRRKMLLLLNGTSCFEGEIGLVDQIEKRFSVDPSLPDINEGVYQTDEFRMYVFKVKPCSRAYSHDWIECPFVHPGENARRRDPRKYHYSCVPCPDFKIGACHRGDACEYAHGIFECWLHPAQYRTRMCKDEERCKRRVCFFAHKPEELRPLYASTGSGIPSPYDFKTSYESSLPSSPRRLSTANATSVLTTRSAAFAKRSWSFTDRSVANRLVGSSSPLSHVPSSTFSDWGSPDGKLNWGIHGEELNKLRKSASFGARNNGNTSMRRQASPRALAHEHEVSWGRSSLKDVPFSSDPSIFDYRNKQHQLNGGNSEMYPTWVDQLYVEQEQIVAL